MIADTVDLAETMLDMGRRARAASRKLGQMTPADRTRGLQAVAAAIRASASKVLAANAQDMDAAEAKGLDAAMLDRLALDAARSVCARAMRRSCAAGLKARTRPAQSLTPCAAR